MFCSIFSMLDQLKKKTKFFLFFNWSKHGKIREKNQGKQDWWFDFTNKIDNKLKCQNTTFLRNIISYLLFPVDDRICLRTVIWAISSYLLSWPWNRQNLDLKSQINKLSAGAILTSWKIFYLSLRLLKFGLSERHTKICAIFLTLCTFT